MIYEPSVVIEPDGTEVLFDSLSLAEKEEVVREVTARAFKAVGYEQKERKAKDKPDFYTHLQPG